MILYSQFGSRGNLGNQLWQLATMIGMAKKYDTSILLPKWNYSKYFGPSPSKIKYVDYTLIDMKLEEPHYHYTPEFWDQHRDDFQNKIVDIVGWLQSEKYFEHATGEVRSVFGFDPEFIYSVKQKAPKDLFNKRVLAISVRRGDFVNNPNHYLLPITYYIGALIKYFPNFREDYNLMIFSDDLNYCKLHFQCLPNVYFADGLIDIEQLCLGSMCDDFIISNSTFSWWMAYLAEGKNTSGIGYCSQIIRPKYVFDGPLLKTHDDRDYFPERWTLHDHKIQSNKVDLTDVTFTIPVNYDSKDRRENVDLNIQTLLTDFQTNIIVGEQGAIKRFDHHQDLCKYVHFSELKIFHRTKMLNEMAMMAKTSIVVNWDADVFVPPLQIIESVQSIRRQESDVVYPYDGRFARVPRRHYKTLKQFLDVGMLAGQNFDGMGDHEARSVGGAILWNRNSFIRGGMENENMISYGPEDCERYDRFVALGFKVIRIGGALYHIDHIKGQNSSVTHPYFNANEAELEKIRLMSPDQLRNYVSRWPWVHQYTGEYYDDISGISRKSAYEVWRTLYVMGIHADTVLDLGCGVGAWLRGYHDAFGVMPDSYEGVDFGVDPNKLLIDQEYYLDHDLKEEFVPNHKYDIVLCTEVAEHLDPEYADHLVDTICKSAGKFILFSAAIPGQSGVGHKNEQWQSWWSQKFFERGWFLHQEDIRKQLWNNNEVGIWYRQNMMVFTQNISLSYNGKYSVDMVHPTMYMNLMRHHGIL